MTSRRAWLGAASVALATGAALSWWQRRRRDDGPNLNGEPGLAQINDAAVAQLLALELTTPSGEPLPMRQFRNKRTVVNFWATWCPPCIEEMPELSQLAQEFASKGVAFVGIAIDQAPNVNRFLDQVPVSYAIGIAGTAGLGLVTALGNPQGGLPFTLLLEPDGSIRERYLGKVPMPALRQVLL